MPPSKLPSRNSRLKNTLSTLKGQSPVERLPDELLDNIFQLGLIMEREWFRYRIRPMYLYKETDDEIDGKEDGEEGDYETDFPENYSVPVRASHVCRRWRQVALNSPALWTLIKFHDNGSPPERIKEWIKRSQRSPLDIALQFTDRALPKVEDEDEDGREEREGVADLIVESYTNILDQVIPHIYRWRSIDIDVNEASYLIAACKHLSGTVHNAPLLESIQLFGRGKSNPWKDGVIHLPTLPLDIYAPKLSKVAGRDLHFAWNVLIATAEHGMPGSIPVSTTNLTELDLENGQQAFDAFASIMRFSPNLCTLRLSDYKLFEGSQGHSGSTIFLPKLRHLTLQYPQEECAISVLRLLYAPALTSIRLCFNGGECTNFINEMVMPMRPPMPVPEDFQVPIHVPDSSSGTSEYRIIDPSRPMSILANAAEANLFRLTCEDASARAFVSACRHLQTLRLHMSILPTAFLTALMEDDGDPAAHSTDLDLAPYDEQNRIMCKRLEVLTVSHVPTMDLMGVVKKRAELGIPIRQLYIDHDDQMNEEDLKLLASNVGELKREGVY